MKHRRVLYFLLHVLLIASAARAARELSFIDLLCRMTDMEHIALLPVDGERCAMWSSSNRDSRYDVDTGKYVDWHANADGDGVIRMEGADQVLAEMDGPGVIWRIWSARPGRGHVRIILDGKPAVDMPFAHYFDGDHTPFNYGQLAYPAAHGHNLYFPIPYNQSCKVIGRPGWGKRYQINYTTLPPGTQLPGFTDATAPETIEALMALCDYLKTGLGSDPFGGREREETLTRDVTATAGQTTVVAELTGARAITTLYGSPAFGKRAEEMAALRELVLQITWDGQPEPAVWCPLGDFLGTAPGMNPYTSLPLGMTRNAFYSLWFMPFARNAKVEIVNDGNTERQLTLHITHSPLPRPFANYGYFHAKWHRDVMPVREDRWPDWTVLRTEGRGRFCGMMLHVWNPRGGRCVDVEWADAHWRWGEGDEKFFVDGEIIPSLFGTDTSNYFGHAWGDPALFHRPYHSQTISEFNTGHISMNRFHIVDNVPFTKSFEACLEKYWPNEWPTLYAAVAYWYLSPDGLDPHGPVPVEQRHGYYYRPPMMIGGHKLLDKTGGFLFTQDMRPFPLDRWTNNDQLYWLHCKPGDRIDVAVPVEADGRYDLSVMLTKAIDYAIVQLSLDGGKLGEPIDLFNNGVIRTAPISLGVHDLTAGEHVLTVEIVGANPKAIKRYMFGLDELRLRTLN